MPDHSPDQWRLAKLNRQIEELEAEKQTLVQRRAQQGLAARRALRRARYLRVAHHFRKPAARFEL